MTQKLIRKNPVKVRSLREGLKVRRKNLVKERSLIKVVTKKALALEARNLRKRKVKASLRKN